MADTEKKEKSHCILRKRCVIGINFPGRKETFSNTIQKKLWFCLKDLQMIHTLSSLVNISVNTRQSILTKIKKLRTKDYFACPRIAKKYIDLIERTFDGKLNLETLEIEKNKFKDGDILVLNDRSPFILKGEATYGYSYYVGIGDMGSLCISTGNTWCGKHENVRYATEAEKIKLFDVLTIEGKRWNAEKKIVEDIKQVPKRSSPIHKKKSDPPEHVFEPFEKVLVRDDDTCKWTIDLFEREDLTGDDDYKYVCLVSAWKYCIHYKGNEHLLDTTNNPD